MIDPVPPRLNLRNLRDIFERIQHLEAFIFFGTLLGYTRERNIIPHDDDIDIYVNRTQMRPLLDALADTDFNLLQRPKAKLLKPWRRAVVVQATRMLEDVDTFADFYLYDARPDNHLIEKWNFKGEWRDPSTNIHVPKRLIFPLKTVEMQGIKMRAPAEPEKVCAFLYGPSWKTPVKKGEGYDMEIVNNVPRFVPKS